MKYLDEGGVYGLILVVEQILVPKSLFSIFLHESKSTSQGYDFFRVCFRLISSNSICYRTDTTPACRLSIVLTILGTGKYRYRWNVAPLNNISSQDFSFRIFFPKPARALLSNAPRIIKIGSLSQFRHPLEFVDPIFRLQNSADLGTQDFPGFSESGSEIMDFLSQTSHFQTVLTLRVFNRCLIGWKF